MIFSCKRNDDMKRFSSIFLQQLKERADLIEIVSSYVSLTASGKFWKACCPFHVEKTPSFFLQQGSVHYHCYGCGAHGDVIRFLMDFLKISFSDAIEILSERLGVCLEEHDDQAEEKNLLKRVLEESCQFFQFHLHHTREGEVALKYLLERGLHGPILQTFRVGLAPKDGALLTKFFFKRKIPIKLLYQVGLIKNCEEPFAFFVYRITFPLFNEQGEVIGFSARKFVEEAIVCKYLHTPDTILCKKSHVLFGLHYTKKTLFKEKRAILVEGQIDLLRLVQSGVDGVLAIQGTSCGDAQIKTLKRFRVHKVILALDGDEAGRSANIKIGNILQEHGLEIFVSSLPRDKDPDEVIRKKGIIQFLNILYKAEDYVTFFVRMIATRRGNALSWQDKKKILQEIREKSQSWKCSVMRYEAERKIAQLLALPESIILKKNIASERVKHNIAVNANQILESDILRWLILCGLEDDRLFPLVKTNLSQKDFLDSACRKVYNYLCLSLERREAFDCLSCATVINLESWEVFDIILHRKVQKEKVHFHLKEAIQKILDRNWLLSLRKIQRRLCEENLSEEEQIALLKQIKVVRPKIMEVS